jgi:hypothetical protein
MSSALSYRPVQLTQSRRNPADTEPDVGLFPQNLCTHLEALQRRRTQQRLPFLSSLVFLHP